MVIELEPDGGAVDPVVEGLLRRVADVGDVCLVEVVEDLLPALLPTPGPIPIDVGQKVNMVVFGINYRFWGGGPRY